MRNCAIWIFAATCAFSRTAFASGFCDNPRGPVGSECQQTRSTHIVVASGPTSKPATARPIVAPGYSSLDLGTYASSPDMPLTFLLDIGGLELATATSDQEVSVLELGIAQSRPSAANPDDHSNDRVLSARVVRHPSGAWALRFVWLKAAATWSVVDSASGDAIELVSADAAMPANVSRVTVNIVPANAWARFDITVGALPASATALPQIRLDNLYAMPVVPAPAQNQPARLRTGVLGGDLTRAGMATEYWFVSPVING